MSLEQPLTQLWSVRQEQSIVPHVEHFCFCRTLRAATRGSAAVFGSAMLDVDRVVDLFALVARREDSLDQLAISTAESKQACIENEHTVDDRVLQSQRVIIHPISDACSREERERYREKRT